MSINYQILVRPLVTEKSTGLQESHNQYSFEVQRQANKIEIRKAVEMAFGVQVEKVRTQIVRGDVRRVGAHYGRKPSWKKAMVTLRSGDSIDLFGED